MRINQHNDLIESIRAGVEKGRREKQAETLTDTHAGVVSDKKLSETPDEHADTTATKDAEQPMRQANRRPTDQCELTSEQRQHLFMQGLARQVGDACAAWLEGRGITCRPLLESPVEANLEAGMSTREPAPVPGSQSLAKSDPPPFKAHFFHAHQIKQKPDIENSPQK